MNGRAVNRRRIERRQLLRSDDEQETRRGKRQRKTLNVDGEVRAVPLTGAAVIARIATIRAAVSVGGVERVMTYVGCVEAGNIWMWVAEV